MAWKTKLVSETTYIELHYTIKMCVLQLNGILLLNRSIVRHSFYLVFKIHEVTTTTWKGIFIVNKIDLKCTSY